jgi:hypothetical protein
MNKQVKTTILLITLISLLATFVSTAKAITIGPYNDGDKVCEYEITLAPGFPTYDPATNVQNWTYNVRCISGYGVSHVDFQFDQICDPPLSVILDAGPGCEDISDSYTDYFPHTTIAGIKIDFEHSVEPGQTKQVWFTLQGEWPVGTITVYVKAGVVPVPNLQGEVAGPECKLNNTVPEVPLGPIIAVASMAVAFGAFVKMRKPKLI